MAKKINKSVVAKNQRSLNDTAKQIAELKALIFNTYENNEAKIQFIKEELSADRYQINSHQIAAKLSEQNCVIQHAQIEEPAELT